MKLCEKTNDIYSKYDLEAAKKLDAFLPSRLFDAHMHVSHLPSCNRPLLTFADYEADMRPLIGNRELRANGIVMPIKEHLTTDAERKDCVAFLEDQFKQYPQNVAEVMVFPTDTAEDIERQLEHPNIRGLKCYHVYANRPDTFNAGIEEYLPEAAWEVANAKGLPITLHMVRMHALADEGNLRYIQTMAKRYPNAVLILAHAARAFAAWTGIETVDQLVGYDNIFFDFSSVCESPAMIKIIKTFGVKRCMWGTDWAISMQAGKCISLGDTFYWISQKDLRQFEAPTEYHSWLVGTEILMATRQACMLCDLNDDAIEDLFYNTAASLFDKK